MNNAELLIYYASILFFGYIGIGLITVILGWILRWWFKRWCGYSDLREMWDDAWEYKFGEEYIDQ